LLALFVVLLCDLIPPFVIGKVVDFFSAYSAGGSLVIFYFYVALLGASMIMTSFFRLSIKRILDILRNELSYKIRVLGFEKLIEESLSVHGEENAGAKDQKIQNGIGAFKNFSNLSDNHLFPAVTTVAGSFGVFFYFGIVYNVVLIFYLVGFIFILKFYRNKLTVLSYKKNLAMEGVSGAYIEGLSNVMTVKSSGAEQVFKNLIFKKERVRKFFDQEIIRVNNVQWKIFQAFNGFYAGVFLLFIGRGVVSGAITVGSIVILLTYLQRITSGAGNVLSIYSSFVDIKTTIARMMTIFWTDNNISTGDKKFPNNWQEIKLNKASYAYKNKKNVKTNINDVELVVKKNQKVGIIGTTGSGKSTLVKLLLGLYKIDSGEYKIGETSFYDIKHDEIFKHMAIVLQESEMFNISLRENIALSEEIDEERLLRAVHIAQLDEVMSSLPNGLETLIGEKGYHLSGGECQRVGIARAIYKDPEIIIFDEATSSLDVKTEQKIQNALLENLQQKNIIIVAHRTNTLEKVDVIYKVGDGKIVKRGSYGDFFEKKK